MTALEFWGLIVLGMVAMGWLAAPEPEKDP